jgi:excisionase family DNA binding protein
MEEKPMTVKEAAIVAGVSEALVYGWCACGKLVHLRLGGKGKRGSIRIRAADLDAFLASCRRGAPTEAPPLSRAPPLKLKHLQL